MDARWKIRDTPQIRYMHSGHEDGDAVLDVISAAMPAAAPDLVEGHVSKRGMHRLNRHVDAGADDDQEAAAEHPAYGSASISVRRVTMWISRASASGTASPDLIASMTRRPTSR